MSKKKKREAQKLSEELTEELKNLNVPKRSQFRGETRAHGKDAKSQNRQDRRQSKQDLKRGDYDQ